MLYYRAKQADLHICEKVFNMEHKCRWKRTDYPIGNIYAPNANLTLYVQYQSRKFGDISIPIRDGYEFMGWNTEADGTGTWITKDRLVKTGMVVYSQWRKLATPAPTPKPKSKLTLPPQSSSDTLLHPKR